MICHMKTVNPIELLVPGRIDLVAKYVYIENYVAKKDVYDYFFECFRAYAQWGRSKKLKLS